MFGIAGLLVFLFVVYKMMQKFGLLKTEEAAQLEKDNQSASSSLENPFSPRYFKSQPGKKIQLLKSAAAKKLADQIYNSIGNFYDDENSVYGAFRQLKYKTQVSQLADTFAKYHQADLFIYLERNFNEKEIKVIHNIVGGLKSGIS